MKAILTRYIGPTDTKGSRIYATDSDDNRVSIPYPHDDLDTEAAHRKAAYALCAKMQWDGHLLGGGTKDGYAFVFAPGVTPKGMNAEIDWVIAERERLVATGVGASEALVRAAVRLTEVQTTNPPDMSAPCRRCGLALREHRSTSATCPANCSQTFQPRADGEGTPDGC